MSKCPSCGSTELVYSSARGDTVCGQCGEVVEERNMVADTTFVASGSGAWSASGVRINFGAGANVSGVSVGRFGFINQSSQEMTMQRGLTKLAHIAERLQLSSELQESGRRMYQLAVQLQFNLGRPTRFVASACLYIVCRRKRTPHLLIDFSDVLKTPVKVLGQVYIRLMRRLLGGDSHSHAALVDGVEVPIIDPSIFIERFSRKLDLGGYQRRVQNTAMRLIQFMHRDWICVGRRPNGLCGAALLIASYYHGQRVSAKDIADIVRLGEETLRVRLLELNHTPLALMSRAEFEKADLSAIPDIEGMPRALPPVMRHAQARAERQAIMDRGGEALMDTTKAQDGVPALAAPPSVKSAIGDSKVRVKRRRRVDSDDEAESVCASAPATPIIRASADIGLGCTATAGSTGVTDVSSKRFTERNPSEGDIEAAARDIASQLDIDAILKSGSSSSSSSKAVAKIDALVSKDSPDLALVPKSAGEVSKQTGDDILPKKAGERALSEGAESEGEEETLSDIDDQELELYLLDEEERKDKSDIWHEVNKDYLEEWHLRGRDAKRKRQQMEQQMAARTEIPSAPAPGELKSGQRWRPKAESCTHSAIMALEKKGKVGVNRINMEALESLFT